MTSASGASAVPVTASAPPTESFVAPTGAEIVADVDALRTLRRLVRVARDHRRVAKTVGIIERFLGGEPFAPSVIDAQLEPGLLAQCRSHGLVAIRADEVVVTMSVVFLRELAVAFPLHQPDDADQVYIGTEAPWLLQLAWRLGPPSGRAADLACGTGVLAAAFGIRYESVVAADIVPAAAQTASLTLALNAVSGASESVACVADVADGLRPGSFDLVVANPPWVPGSGLVYADGGAKGAELPRCFAEQASALLCSGGLALVAMLDSQWEDGSLPLADIEAQLQHDGFSTERHHAPDSVWSADDEADLRAKVNGCLGGRLVALAIRRN